MQLLHLVGFISLLSMMHRTTNIKLMVTYCNFTNPPKMFTSLRIMVLFQRFTRIFKPNIDFIQLFFSLHLMFPFSFLSSSDHVSLNLYAIICRVVLSGNVISWNLHWHVLTSVAVSFFIYHHILYMSPCSTCMAFERRKYHASCAGQLQQWELK